MRAFKRWCAACLHDHGYRPWVIFRFPETVDYFNLVQVQRPRPLLLLHKPEHRLDERGTERRRLREEHRIRPPNCVTP